MKANSLLAKNEYFGFLFCLQEGMGQDMGMRTKNILLYSGILRT